MAGTRLFSLLRASLYITLFVRLQSNECLRRDTPENSKDTRTHLYSTVSLGWPRIAPAFTSYLAVKPTRPRPGRRVSQAYPIGRARRDLVVWCLLVAGDVSPNPGPLHQTRSCCTGQATPDTASEPSSAQRRESADASRPASPLRSRQHLNIWYSNVRSAKNKLRELNTFVESMPNTVFALSETWLSSSTHDGQIVDADRFQVFRKDRIGSRGGGVMIVVPGSLPCRRRCDLEQDDLEAVFVEARSGNHTVLLICVYVPPKQQSSSFEALRVSVDLIERSRYANICLVGDFNTHIDWSDMTAPIPSDPLAQNLLDLTESSGFIQCCPDPTRASSSGREAHLDLFFTTNPSLLVDCTVEDSLTNCDHKAIHVRTYMSIPRLGRFARLVHRYSQADLAHLRMLLHLAPWSMVLGEGSIDDMYELWRDFMEAILSELFRTPQRNVGVKPPG